MTEADAVAPVRGTLALIGRTPMVELTRFDTGPCRLFVKLESQNPGGSIKDRIALAMIEAAERDGRLGPHATLVEATAGNTGLGLALVAAQKGYRLILVVPDKMAREKVLHVRALGAQVIVTRSDVAKGHPEYYQDMAERIAAETPGAFYVNQFANPANPAAHFATTAPEIARQMAGAVDAIVCGVGSGGTMTGIGRFFARHHPATEMVLADPVGSVLAPLVTTGRLIEAGSWAVEGIGEDFVPPNLDLAVIRHAYAIPDAESLAVTRELLTDPRGPARRFVLGYAGRRGAALLPRADPAQAGGDADLRQRRQVPVQGVQRRLAARTGLWPSRPDRHGARPGDPPA